MFTNDKIKFRYFWKTRLDLISYVEGPRYPQRKRSQLYVGETKRNPDVRWRKHYSTKKTSEVGDHLLLNFGHKVIWEILINAPKQGNKRNILEAFYIRTLQRTLNN